MYRIKRILESMHAESGIVACMWSRLLLRWQTEGKGWFFCEYWLASLVYADDILIFSENKDDVVKMIGELIDAFAQVGLDISVDKCAWSSYPPEKTRNSECRRFWVEVGQIIDFCRHRHKLQW